MISIQQLAEERHSCYRHIVLLCGLGIYEKSQMKYYFTVEKLHCAALKFHCLWSRPPIARQPKIDSLHDGMKAKVPDTIS